MRASPSQRRVFWLVCAVILMVVTYTHRSGPGHGFTAVTTTQDAEAIAFAEEGDSNNNATCRKCTVKDQILDPHYEIVKHQPKIPATEMVWQIPENCKGVVLLAHGCSHRATDFWPFSTACQRCIGLPEEVYIVKVALSMGLAPVAISSHFKRCWSEGDVEVVADVLEKWMQNHNLMHLPLFAVGASSGGNFVAPFADFVNTDSRLAGLGMHVQAIDVQIATFLSIPKGLSAMALTRMSRDQDTEDFAKGMGNELSKDGMAVLDNVAEPLTITKSFFYDRVEKLSKMDSFLIFKALKTAGMLDAKGLLVSDPRESKWRDVLKAEIPELVLLDALKPDESPISEELNVAWAYHEFTGDFIRRTFEFFLVHVKP